MNRPPQSSHPPPGVLPYVEYGQMPPMQPYSPCPPQPPMPSYPQQTATPQPGQLPMHPAYQQPPQLPGGYPRSPSRMNHHRAAHLQEWMNPHEMNNYSPAPSVAPSVMSNMSGMYSDHSSVMSYQSMAFDMPMPCPPDMRSPSQISGSENIDPMNFPHPPEPSQPSPANLAQQLPLFKQYFFQHPQIVPSIVSFFHQLSNTKKEADARQLKAQLAPLVELTPLFIEALALFLKQNTASESDPYKKVCYCFLRIVHNFPKEVVAKEFEAVKRGMGVITENLMRHWDIRLLGALDIILDCKVPEVCHILASLTIRAQLPFVMALLAKISSPDSPSVLGRTLGILTSLATNAEETKNFLANQTDKFPGLIPILFERVHPYLQKCIQLGKDKPLCLRTYQKVIMLISLLLGESDLRPDDVNHRNLYKRRVKVAAQLARWRALEVVCQCFGEAITIKAEVRKPNETIVKGASILKTCSELLAGSSFPTEDANDVQYFRTIMTDQQICLPLAHCLFETGSRLFGAPQILCGKSHRFLAQSIYQLMLFSPDVLNMVKNHFLGKILHWITQLITLKYGETKKYWGGICGSALDTEDTVIYMFNMTIPKFGVPVPQTIIDPDKAENLLRMYLNQLSDFFHSGVLLNSGPAWEHYISLFKTLLHSIGRLVMHVAAIQFSLILTLVTDTQAKQNAIGWLFQVVDNFPQLIARKEVPEREKRVFVDVAKEAFVTLTKIWMTFDPARNPNGDDIRSKIKNYVIHNSTPHIMGWITTTGDMKMLQKVLNFCCVVCVDEVAVSWSTNHSTVFRDLCLSQDSDINRVANQICASFNPESSMFDDMSQAMDFYQ